MINEKSRKLQGSFFFSNKIRVNYNNINEPHRPVVFILKQKSKCGRSREERAPNM